MSTTYGCRRSLGGTNYACSGMRSAEEAEDWVYLEALKDGNWRPRELRQHWWQFWKPKKHSDLENRIMERAALT